ncbi:hypothetical protein [Ensifer aridi]|uniref:hypothetical protein n=1 Tax=Ensifer aridi TaxID=1708715 RepID=UPI000A119F24|nr:hypothetical protein [Ensifer aridi]
MNYTHLHMEAVACLWEAFVDANMRGWSRDPDNPSRDRDAEPLTGNAAGLYAAWLRVGTVEMRHAAINLADLMLKTWDAMTEDEREECIPYDWEFAPAFLAVIEWDHQGTPINLTEPRAMADAVLALQRRNQ